MDKISQIATFWHLASKKAKEQPLQSRQLLQQVWGVEILGSLLQTKCYELVPPGKSRYSTPYMPVFWAVRNIEFSIPFFIQYGKVLITLVMTKIKLKHRPITVVAMQKASDEATNTRSKKPIWQWTVCSRTSNVSCMTLANPQSIFRY